MKIMKATISMQQYKDDEKWVDKNPGCRRGLYCNENDGKLSLILKRIPDNDSGDISGWYQVSYPGYLQKEINVPAFTLWDPDPAVIELEWVDDLPRMGRPRKTPLKKTEYNGEMKDCFEEVVKAQGNTGRLYPPKDWIGSTVIVIRLY